MAPTHRKNRHREQRERAIIDTARHLLLEHGYRGLNMDRIADATDYSKGTLYQHFTCKEDVLAGLVLRALEDRYRLLERASLFSGRSREKIVAVGMGDELFHRLHPDYLRAQQVIRVGSLTAKISRHRLRSLRKLQERILGIVDRVVRAAMEQGDLQLSHSQSVAEVSFALWALVHGIRTVGGMPMEMKLLGLRAAHEAAHKAGATMLDGLGWQPLSSAWDYAATRTRIASEVFPDHADLLQDPETQKTLTFL